MSTFKDVNMPFGNGNITLPDFVTYSVNMQVPAFTETLEFQDIRVYIIPRTDTNYNVFFKTQGNVAFSTEKWLTVNVFNKYNDNFTARVYNEQKHAIKSLNLACMIVPAVTV